MLLASDETDGRRTLQELDPDAIATASFEC
jgi:hypothetical protein